jgi:hypothetical protein
MLRTINPGTLIVQSAYPDPPFDLMRDGIATGFDLELMRAVCRRLRLELRAIAYQGDNFNDIFEGLIRRNLRRRDLGHDDHARASRSREIFTALPDIQSGYRRKAANDAERGVGS